MGPDDRLLTDGELEEVERDYPDGLTSVQIVDIFTARGIRFSEATFRKYVQQGLLPRSRRVGRKGKHKGSLGLYPPQTARRINAIKKLMSDDYTIDEIQGQFFRFRDEIEQIAGGLQSLLGGFENHLEGAALDARTHKDVKKEIAEARRSAEDLVKRIERIEGRITDPTQTRSSRAPEGAEDLL